MTIFHDCGRGSCLVAKSSDPHHNRRLHNICEIDFHHIEEKHSGSFGDPALRNSALSKRPLYYNVCENGLEIKPLQVPPYRSADLRKYDKSFVNLR